MAQQSIVLLKNENNLLPLDRKQIKKIAVTGPNADSESVLLANYYGYPTEITTLLEGIRAKAGSDVEVIYDKGVNLTDNYVFTSHYNDALFTWNGQPGFKADYYRNLQREGTPELSRIEKKVDYRWGDGQNITDSLITRRMSASWSTVFTPDETADVCFELKADDWAELHIDGVKQEKTGNINAYYPLKAEKGKPYRIDIYYRQYADNAEINFDLGVLRQPRAKDVADALKDADVIIYAGGISAKVEGEEMGVVIDGFRRGDRTSIDLPAVQKELLRELQATGKPVVFVLMTGSAIGLEWESRNIPAILNAWYGGQAGGQAIADVLFGDYNPAGRLPVTFYRSADDLPDFEDYSMANRTYRYFRGTPVYPFGYGLSYTTFRYSEPNIATADGGSLHIRATVTNDGPRDGDEVVQLYASNPRDFTTPIRSLKGFRRIHLKAGESQTVEFTLTPDDLSVVNVAGHLEPMKGEVTLTIGGGQPSASTLAARQCLQQTLVL
jgi:beta-glucosidase